MVLGTEAESLTVRDSERILERESPGTKLNFNHSFQAAEVPDFPGTKTLFPAGPLTTCGCTISGRPSYAYVQEFGPPLSKEISIVIQESKTTPGQTATTATTKTAMGKKCTIGFQ